MYVVLCRCGATYSCVRMDDSDLCRLLQLHVMRAWCWLFMFVGRWRGLVTFLRCGRRFGLMATRHPDYDNAEKCWIICIHYHVKRPDMVDNLLNNNTRFFVFIFVVLKDQHWTMGRWHNYIRWCECEHKLYGTCRKRFEIPKCWHPNAHTKMFIKVWTIWRKAFAWPHSEILPRYTSALSSTPRCTN